MFPDLPDSYKQMLFKTKHLLLVYLCRYINKRPIKQYIIEDHIGMFSFTDYPCQVYTFHSSRFIVYYLQKLNKVVLT